MSSDSTVSARALASRRNGARSRGPKSAAGKARSARNALKHGLCARTIVLRDEDAAAFARFAAALRADLAPADAVQAELVARVVSAAWRARRADRMEAAVLAAHLEGPRVDPEIAIGYALLRDGHGPRMLDTLVRYRNSVRAELFRALAALKALQADAGTLAATNMSAAPSPVRRRARPPITGRNQSGRMRQNDSSTDRSAVEPRHDAPDPQVPAAGPAPLASTAPAAQQDRESTPDQRLEVRTPRRSHHDAPGRDRPDTGPAALPSPLTRTKRTQESKPKQSLGVRVPQRLAS